MTAEQLRRKIADIAIDTDEGEVSFTCSFGVSEWQADDTVDSLLNRADAAQYCAKENGRNQVIVYTPEAERAMARQRLVRSA